MTKAEQILDLYPAMFAKHGEAACRLVAEEVGCQPVYVRVVARQRKGRASAFDKAYAAKIYAAGNRAFACEAARLAYVAARADGLSVSAAHKVRWQVFHRAMRKTGVAARRVA